MNFLQSVANVLSGALTRAQAEERQKALTDDLDHRVKNILAVVGNIAQRTGKEVPTVPAFLDAFAGRIAAIARTQSRLSRGDLLGADLSELLRDELEPFAGRNTRIEGPPIDLPSDIAQVVSMTLHELATNAAKHGALSEPHGEVSVQWKCESVGTPDGRLVIEWRESGGPEVKPSRCGYGSGLIRELIPYEVPGSSVDLDPAPSGVTCRIVLPLAQIFPNGS